MNFFLTFSLADCSPPPSFSFGNDPGKKFFWGLFSFSFSFCQSKTEPSKSSVKIIFPLEVSSFDQGSEPLRHTLKDWLKEMRRPRPPYPPKKGKIWHLPLQVSPAIRLILTKNRFFFGAKDVDGSPFKYILNGKWKWDIFFFIFSTAGALVVIAV